MRTTLTSNEVTLRALSELHILCFDPKHKEKNTLSYLSIQRTHSKYYKNLIWHPYQIYTGKKKRSFKVETVLYHVSILSVHFHMLSREEAELPQGGKGKMQWLELMRKEVDRSHKGK